ncbi:MAG: phage portal protein [Sphingomonadales bacterium]|nr:phage portal protein [Sphingomonadales bacterium]
MDKPRLTLIDRAIAAVAPGRAAQRLAARASYMAMAAAVTEPGGRLDTRGGYRAGQSDRRQTRGWFARTRSANSDGLARQQTLIGRSREAAMNLPAATAAIERNVTFTIGTGLMALPDLDAEVLGLMPEEKAAWTARMKRDYDAYMSSTDPDAERSSTGYGQQEIVLRGMLESGDVLGLRCAPADQIGRVVWTAWKLVEAERVASPSGHVEGLPLGKGGPIVVGGVQLDGYGAAEGYHVIQKAPDRSGLARTATDTKFYPAWGAQSRLPAAVLVFDKRRPEQARGVPFLAPVLELVKMFADATDAASLSLVLQSMLSVIYKSPGASAMPEPEYGTGEIVQAEYAPETQPPPANSSIAMEPGMVLELDNDSEVKLVSPDAKNPVYEKFFEAVLTQIGAATGTPFGVLMARFNSSYTASKGELELFYKEIVRRLARFAPMWCDPHYHCWLYEQVARGVYDLPGFLDDPRLRQAWCSVRWAGDGKISLDPYRERQALAIDEAHGWQTGAQIAAQINGGDFAANVEQRGEEIARMKGAGMPMPVAPGAGGGQPNTGDAPGEAKPQDNGDGNNG